MTSTKVVIVGGGIAGIKAALKLQSAGIEYLILEAKNRLGGRLKTVQGINSKYDLGASWFHETLNNELFDEEVRTPGNKTKFFYDDAPVKIMNHEGVVPPSMKLDSIAEEIYKYVELETYKDLEADKSFYDTVVKYLKERKDLLTEEQIANVMQYVRFFELWHGVDIQRLSAKFFSIDNFGRDAYCLYYDSLLKRHTDQLDDTKVKLNTAVSSIKKVSQTKKVQVTTTSNEVFEADYAIVTVPQSILQLDPTDEGYINFEPPLPAALKESLQHIHFGALGKVVLEFEEVFWPTDSERVLVLSTPPEGFLNSILEDEAPPKLDLNGTPKSWEYPVLVLNQATTFQHPSLVCLIQSPVTEYIESNPSKAWEYLKPIISKLASSSSIPTPKNIITSDWTQDKYQRGSYSACFTGDDPLIPIVQFENGFGNIRFAGEHTILEGAGCVHGAWNSGKREADYIIDQVTQNK